MLTASIVTYHTPINEIRKIIDCVLTSSIDILYVVDNSSNDNLRQLKQLSSRINYIYNATNLGYGRAHNIAIRKAVETGSKYHIVINPDIYFEDGVIEALAEYMDLHTDTGWVMPRVVYPNGELQYLCKLLPTPFDLILRRFIPANLFRSARNKFELRASGYDKEMNIPSLSGCFMFMRIESLKKVGLFDERFFMYGEDVDLSRRMHAEYRTMYYPAVTIVHAHEKASYKSHKMMWVHISNIVKYFNKWGWLFDKERRRVNRQTLSDLNI